MTLDLIERVEDIIERTPAEKVPKEWELAAAGLRVLANQATCLDLARTGGGNLLEEQVRGEVLTREFRRRLSRDSLSPSNRLENTRRSLIEDSECDPTNLRALLATIPLPTVYWSAEQSPRRFGELRDEPVARRKAMLRVIVFLDQQPVASPQFLSQGVLYQLMLRLRGLEVAGKCGSAATGSKHDVPK